MSYILLKKVQDNLITTPASNYVKFFSNFNDNGLLYYMDNSGVPTPAVGGGGSTYNPVIEITYSDLYSLTGNFATGSYYYITDFDSVYEQPDFYFDGTPKTVLDIKGKPAIAYQPIIIMATSNNTLAPDAYQPFFPKDKIKYDFTWNKTEFNRNAKGRITERIDCNGNRTDYDHRTIRFKRYQRYDKSSLLLGTITSYNCVTGEILGNSTSFGTDFSVGDVLLIDSDSMSGGDLSYTIGVRVKSIIDDSTIESDVDNLYTSGVPSNVVLNSTSQIIPINYSFTSKNYTYSKGTSTSEFNRYKEVYFGQSDAFDYDNDVFTFTTTGYGTNIVSTVVNNYIGDYSHVYLNGSNNSLILSNNVFGNTTDSFNTIGSNSYNNHLSSSSNNKIGNFFYNNIIGDFFQYNLIKCEVSNLDLTSSTLKGGATHIYNSYNCEIFRNSNNVVRLSYYAISTQRGVGDVLTITDIDD